MHAYTYTCIHMHPHAYTCIHMHTHAYTCIHMRTYAYTCIHMHTHAYTCAPSSGWESERYQTLIEPTSPGPSMPLMLTSPGPMRLSCSPALAPCASHAHQPWAPCDQCVVGLGACDRELHIHIYENYTYTYIHESYTYTYTCGRTWGLRSRTPYTYMRTTHTHTCMRATHTHIHVVGLGACDRELGHRRVVR